jgi:hypothetical protein
MHAEEARRLSEGSRPPLGEVLAQIEKAAHQGSRRIVFPDMGEATRIQLKSLGYVISRRTDFPGMYSVIVEW